MMQPREAAAAAMATVGRVAEVRMGTLQDIGARVRLSENRGTSPSVRLEVSFEDDRWTEYIESACTRGAHAFDVEYLDRLTSDSWVVLHYPRSLINEEFARLKARRLLDLALDSGVDRPEVWVYLYDRDGSEHRVL